MSILSSIASDEEIETFVVMSHVADTGEALESVAPECLHVVDLVLGVEGWILLLELT